MSEGFEGWFYKQNGERFGPVSSGQLQELVGSGQVQPRQAVWKYGNHSLLFMHAATAASAPRANLSSLGKGCKGHDAIEGGIRQEIPKAVDLGHLDVAANT